MINPAFMCTGIVVFRVRLHWSRRLCCASVLACLLLSACDGTDTHSDSEIPAKGDRTQGVLTKLWSELRPSEDIPLRPIRFPADLSPHPEQTTESFQLQAFLIRDDGSIMSVLAQLDRLALGIRAMASSKWGFSDIMRTSVAMGNSDQPALTVREIVERRALGLANSDQNTIHVIDTKLELQTQTGNQAELMSADECSVSYHFSTALIGPQSDLNEAFSMDFTMPSCPETLSLRGLNRWQASALTATGTAGRSDTMPATGNQTRLQGHVWLSHTWGNVPAAGGAVLIDQVNLRLTTDSGAGRQLLSASRSKRKTGLGPRTVQGSISSLADDRQALELQWIDEGERTSPMTGIVYPQHFRLRNQDESIELLLTPVVAMAEIRDSLGIRWHGAVAVSGTHEGAGFVNFQPLSGDGHDLTIE